MTGTVMVSVIGIAVGSLTGKFHVEYPAFISWQNPSGLPLFPLLFTTIACGACSGFHSLVASGTTSKQLDKETDAVGVGYGGMLLESVVAIIALSTVMVLGAAQAQELKDPSLIYANGIASFLSVLGIPKEFALNFALLAFATFVYDTLDVATRLGRYIFAELMGWRNAWSHYAAGLTTLILPAVFLLRAGVDGQGNPVAAWKVFWTVFGSSNQLLAGMVLFVVSVWLFRRKMRFGYVLVPAVFMLTTSLISMGLIVRPALENIFAGKWTLGASDIVTLLLAGLAVFLTLEGALIFIRKTKGAETRGP